MKKIAIMICVLTAHLVFSGCTSDINYKQGSVTAVKTLNLPVDNFYAELVSKSGTTLRFEWEPAFAEDGQSPLYEVVFFRSQNGPEVYRHSAGAKTYADIAHKQLNRIAGYADIETGEEGVLYWSVASSRGTFDVLASAAPRKLTINRLNGFAVIPENVYITGTGTENGTDISRALQMKAAGEDEGEFEVFTRFTDGTYNIVSGRGEGARVFNITAGELAESDTPTQTPGTGIYRLKIDFNTRNYECELVENMRFVACITGNENHYLTYQGNGVWNRDNFEPAFANDSWGDDRYFFRADIGGVNTKLGAKNDNFGDAINENTGPQFYIYLQGEGAEADWSYSFKTIPAYHSAKDKPVNVTLYLSGDVENYYHLVEYLDE